MSSKATRFKRARKTNDVGVRIRTRLNFNAGHDKRRGISAVLEVWVRIQRGNGIQ